MFYEENDPLSAIDDLDDEELDEALGVCGERARVSTNRLTSHTPRGSINPAFLPRAPRSSRTQPRSASTNRVATSFSQTSRSSRGGRARSQRTAGSQVARSVDTESTDSTITNDAAESIPSSPASESNSSATLAETPSTQSTCSLPANEDPDPEEFVATEPSTSAATEVSRSNRGNRTISAEDYINDLLVADIEQQEELAHQRQLAPVSQPRQRPSEQADDRAHINLSAGKARDSPSGDTTESNSSSSPATTATPSPYDPIPYEEPGEDEEDNFAWGPLDEHGLPLNFQGQFSRWFYGGTKGFEPGNAVRKNPDSEVTPKQVTVKRIRINNECERSDASLRLLSHIESQNESSELEPVDELEILRLRVEPSERMVAERAAAAQDQPAGATQQPVAQPVVQPVAGPSRAGDAVLARAEKVKVKMPKLSVVLEVKRMLIDRRPAIRRSKLISQTPNSSTNNGIQSGEPVTSSSLIGPGEDCDDSDDCDVIEIDCDAVAQN